MLPITTLFKQLFYILGTLIISWILVHFIAIFGIFLAAGLPILHLFFYPHILCFWCRLKGGKHTFAHSFIDALLLTILTLFSIGVVYGETKLISYLGVNFNAPTVSFVIPGKSQHLREEIFSMPIEIVGIEKPINVVQADLTFDPTILEVVDIDTEGSFASIIVQKDWSNEMGYARLAAGLPNPGFNEQVGHFGTVYFRGKNQGIAEVKFMNTSLVLANNGRGSNVLKDLSSTSFVILPEAIPESEQLRQKDLIIKKQVLGEETSSDQLDFTSYQMELPKPFAGILGESTMSTPIATTKKNSFLSLLGSIDDKILSFWRSLLP